MGAADVAQVASAVFTAVAAAAALLTVRHARSENRLARDALEAQTQPLLIDVPRGLFREEVDWHEASGAMTRRLVDRAEINVGASGPEPVSHASLPVRNVGTGAARINNVQFRLADGSIAEGDAGSQILPVGELTRVTLARAPGDAGHEVAEAIGLEYADFTVVIAYSDASRRPRETVRLEIRNGQHPFVRARAWTESGRDRPFV